MGHPVYIYIVRPEMYRAVINQLRRARVSRVMRRTDEYY